MTNSLALETLPTFKKSQKFRIDWVGSKDLLAKYIFSLGAPEVVRGMLYDLGHYGRGFSEFGSASKPVELSFKYGKFEQNGRLIEAYALQPVLLKTICEAISKYDPEKTAWQRDIGLLLNLSNSLDQKALTTLKFDQLDSDNKRNLLKIS